MRATTDSEGSIRFDREEKPGISNLITIYSAFSGKNIPTIEKEYEGCGYGTFKKDLIEITVNALEPIKEKFSDIRNSSELKATLKEGAERAKAIADSVLARVKNNFGLGIK